MKQKTKDNLIYLGVAGIVVAIVVLYLYVSDQKSGIPREISGPILWGIISTPGIIAIMLDQFWSARRSVSFWIVAIITALINVSVASAAYLLHWNLSVVVWSLITFSLVIVAFLVLGMLGHSFKRR